MKREVSEHYAQGLRAGIAARAAAGGSHAGEEAVPPSQGAFDLAAKLAGCAAGDRAPDAEERLAFERHGFHYLGPEKDGFLVGIALPGGLIEARQLLALASISQQFADGSVEHDAAQGWLGLRVVSVCDAPELLRQLDSAGLRTATLPEAGSSPTRKRLLSGEMLSLAEKAKAHGAIALEIVPF